MKKILLSLILALSLLFSCAFAGDYAARYGLNAPVSASEVIVEGDVAITEDLLVEYGEHYSDPDEVALYLHVFCELPLNFITKDEARDLGWVNSEGNLWEVAYGMSIGGDRFGNREGILPEAHDRQYYECDVNYSGGYRGSERLVFSDDGLIYYTGDHYESFDLLYDGWYEGETYTDYGYSYASDDSDDYGSLLGDLLYGLLG